MFRKERDGIHVGVTASSACVLIRCNRGQTARTPNDMLEALLLRVLRHLITRKPRQPHGELCLFPDMCVLSCHERLMRLWFFTVALSVQNSEEGENLSD